MTDIRGSSDGDYFKSAAESRMRGDLHVRFGGRWYLDPTIIMPLLCYLD